MTTLCIDGFVSSEYSAAFELNPDCKLTAQEVEFYIRSGDITWDIWDDEGEADLEFSGRIIGKVTESTLPRKSYWLELQPGVKVRRV